MLEAFGDKACFTYNSAGIRTEKCIKGVPTKYIVSGSTILSETTGGVTTVYYHSTDGVIGFNRAGVDYYYRKNLQGDIIAIVNTNGGIVAKYVYDAWGNHKVYTSADTLIYDSQNPSSANSSHIGCINPFRYRSYYFDSETGLYYLQSRYYDPQVGRFLNADSIDYLAPENIQGLNLYSYCQNNPVMYADPTGNLPQWAMWLIGGVVIAGLAIATIATGGAAGGVAGFILAGALKGAIVGAVSGALLNGTISGISSAIDGEGFWSGFFDGAAHGFMSGAVIGGITGAISSGVQVYNASKLWANTGNKTAYKQMVEHYGKHVIREGQKSVAKNIVNYSKQASQFFANNSSSGFALRQGVIKIAGAPGGIFNADGLIRSFWYVLL